MPPVIALGTSAGGVEVLWALLARLPAKLRAAILVVMHLSPHSGRGLPDVLARHSPFPVKFAEDGEPLRAGEVFLAPPDQHLLLEGQRLRLSRGPKECRVRPAVDALFRSVAVTCGPRAIGVILTGLLDDGTAGLWALKDRGGVALVQDPREATYDSMPLSAIEHVAVDAVATTAGLAQRIAAEVDRIAALQPAPAGHDVEVLAAAGTGNLEEEIMSLGPRSKYACPECHGVLIQIEEGRIVRFRCHTGHATPCRRSSPNWTRAPRSACGTRSGRSRRSSCCWRKGSSRRAMHRRPAGRSRPCGSGCTCCGRWCWKARRPPSHPGEQDKARAFAASCMSFPQSGLALKVGPNG